MGFPPIARAIRLPPATGEVWERLRALPPEVFPLTAKRLAQMIEAASVGPINRLVKLGLLREVERRRIRAAWAEHAVEPDRSLTLTAAQRAAVDAICATVSRLKIACWMSIITKSWPVVFARRAISPERPRRASMPSAGRPAGK